MFTIYLYILVFQQIHDIAMKHKEKTVRLAFSWYINVKFKAMELKLMYHCIYMVL